jgi:hypothetical protein
MIKEAEATHVALSSPPRVWPSFIESCSVASPSSCAGQSLASARQYTASSGPGQTYLCEGDDGEEGHAEAGCGGPSECFGCGGSSAKVTSSYHDTKGTSETKVRDAQDAQHTLSGSAGTAEVDAKRRGR